MESCNVYYEMTRKKYVGVSIRRCFELPLTSKFLILCVWLDTRFILVQVKCLYVQFVATARVTSTESS